MSDLVGKKKLVINDELWGAPEQTAGHEPVFEDPNFDVMVQNSPVGMTFLAYDSNGFQTEDNLRIALGKNWNTAPEDSNDENSQVVTKNDWGSLKLFYGQPLGIKYCFEGQGLDSEYPGFYSEAGSPTIAIESFFTEGLIADPIYFEAIWKEKIVVSCSVPKGPKADLEDDAAANPELNKFKRPNLELWSGFIKTGVISDGKYYFPIIKNKGNGLQVDVVPGRMYGDHYHESVNPFTPKELLSKQPFGKSAFANVSTYYKSTSASTSNMLFSNLSYEKFIGQLADPSNIGVSVFPGNVASFNTIMPTPYGFLRLMTNKFEVEDLYDLDVPSSTLFPHPYKNVGQLFKNFPLEALTTYFSRVPHQTLSKFMKSSFKNLDISAFMDEYFIRWQEAHTSINTKGTQSKSTRSLFLQLLDQRLSNIVISPEMIKKLDKVESIKKYFPFYCELEFSTSIFTELGDLIKKLLFTKFFTNKIAEFNTRDYSDPSQLATTHTPAAEVPFYDHYTDGYYENILADEMIGDQQTGKTVTQSNLQFSVGSVDGSVSQEVTKKVYDIASLLNTYLDEDNVDYYRDPGDNGTSLDIQDYITYLRSDLEEPINIDEYNNVWKNVLGQILKVKLLKTYKKHHRTYQDLLEGKPAYYETIAYKIEKFEKNPEDAPSAYTPVQSFIIPNTSELDVFKYVDTQVRYGDTKVYRYDVNAIKIVFGCNYRYSFNDEADGFEAVDASTPEKVLNPNNYQDLLATPFSEDGEPQQYSATCGVEIYPSIVMMEDLYFRTPDIIISDNPPISPDVNIVPYRAVNDRILILLNNMIDSHRLPPIEILDSDNDKFEFNKKAQLTPDDKILFSSDDAIKKYEIFRTEKEPYSYTDFERIEQTSKTHYVDQITPNKRYWYCFRSIDDHGNISNPTAVFEVELVDDQGAVRPMIRVFNFKEPKNSQAIKECQKYLMIRPSFEQIYYDGEKDLDHMFNNKDDTTKRKFKIRLTSKSTGRKIDFNVAFNKKAVT
tara:strand:+ start:7191 stop:10199 length:3009 start_codon:yes stop_codon:yes gene_type:complete